MTAWVDAVMLLVFSCRLARLTMLVSGPTHERLSFSEVVPPKIDIPFPLAIWKVVSIC